MNEEEIERRLERLEEKVFKVFEVKMNKKKIEVGDIVSSRVWSIAGGMIIESIIKTKRGLVINGDLYEDAEYEDFERIGITIEKCENESNKQ